MEANALGTASTIILPAGSYTLSLPGPGEDAAATGDLDILAPITVQGAGSGMTTIHGDGTDRLFDIHTPQGVSVLLQHLTLTGGQADTGGAVRVQGASLTLTDVALTGNQATGDGGALAAAGSAFLTLRQALFQNNSAGGSGGALAVDDGSTAIVFATTIAGNTAGGVGGGLAVLATTGSVSGAQFHQSTLSGNTAGGQGGGGYVGPGSLLFLTDSTVTLNRSAAGGGFFQDQGQLGLGNTIVAGNSGADGGPDVFGAVTSQGFNLVGDGSNASGLTSTDLAGTAAAPIDPKLSPLILRGGPTPVHVPTPGSPALDRGQAFDTTDQRGVTRPQTGADIGSVEAKTFGITSPSGGQHAAVGSAFGPLQAVVTEGGTPLPGATVTFVAPATGPGGTFADTPTLPTDAGGVATAPTFTANFQAGSYAVRASASANLFVNIPLVNDPAPAGTLAITGLPPSIQAGVPFTITVTALKPDGSRNTAYAGTVTFSTDAAGSTLPGPTTFTSADQGQKTFTVTLGAVGTHTLSVADTTGAPGGQVTVTVAPTTNRFDITAPATVNEGEPFAVTVTIRDAAGNVLTNFTGPVTFTSDDPRAVLPTGVVFTANDGGVKRIDGLALRPPGPRTVTVTAPDGTTGSVTVGVVNFGPSELVVTPTPPAVTEGDAVTLSGSFFNPDPGDTHTVVVDWGDGTARSVVGAVPPGSAEGAFTFQATHTYTDDPPGPNDTYKISVTVTDAAGGSTSGGTSVIVSNAPPQLPPSGLVAVGDEGSPLNQTITFTDPGSDSWTANVSYGDGSTQVIAVGPGRSFTLDHVYQAEGTFTVSVKLTDDDGGSAGFTERAVIFLPGTTGVKVIVVPAGQSRTLAIAGAEVTLDNEGGTGPAVLLLGSVNLAALNGLAGSPTADRTQRVTAYDIRVLDPGPASVLTARLTYPAGVPGADPAVLYYDQAAGRFRSVRGSALLAGSFALDRAARRATFLLDGTSTPTDFSLGGTVFALSVPAPQPQQSANAGTTPFFLASAAPGSPAVAALGETAVAAPIPTTGLVSSSTLTVAVSAAEGLQRGGGDETAVGRITPQAVGTLLKTFLEIRDFVVEALRMWIDQPAPMEAPAAVIPPPDTIDQVHLRQLTEDVAAATKTVEAAPPQPAAVEYEAVPLPPPAVEVDPVVATAETHPWWLKSYEKRAEPAATDPIPIRQAEPTDADRVAVGVTAVWIGGAALAAVAPEPPADDEDRWQPPREDGDEE